MISRRKQKDIERGILEAARRASSLFPIGIIEDFEEPDLRIKMDTGWLGVEVTEIVRPKEATAPPTLWILALPSFVVER